MKSALLVSILGALSACSGGTEDGQACMNVPAEQTTCPPASSVSIKDLYSESSCGSEVVAVKGEGKRRLIEHSVTEACCYPAEVTSRDRGCVVGRPYWEGGELRQASLLASVAASPATDSARAAAWALAGSGEHA